MPRNNDRVISELQRQLQDANARYDRLVEKILEHGLGPRDVMAKEKPEPEKEWPTDVVTAIHGLGLDPKTPEYRDVVSWVNQELGSGTEPSLVAQQVTKGWLEEVEDR